MFSHNYKELKVKPDYSYLVEVMFKALTGHYYAEDKVVDQLHSGVLQLNLHHKNGCFNHKVITLEEKVVVRD